MIYRCKELLKRIYRRHKNSRADFINLTDVNILVISASVLWSHCMESFPKNINYFTINDYVIYIWVINDGVL